MNYETILIQKNSYNLTITFNRPERQNSINQRFLEEINDALDIAEKDSEIKLVILEGHKGVFCTGMDFQEISEAVTEGDSLSSNDILGTDLYMKTIKRFSTIPLIVVSLINGRVMAGGVGFAAASDLVIATPQTQFNLSETLWGLLPAMVAPYLIRRTGFHNAYKMALTTMQISAEQAMVMNLVDEISDNPNEALKRLRVRLSRIETWTIGNLKQYFRKMWTITEEVEDIAINETKRLMSDPRVIQNITNYINYKKFPWEK